MLSARLDPPTALRAADDYAAGSEVDYRQSGATCFRATVAGVNGPSDTYLATVLRRWAATMPAAGIDATGGLITFHSCDPGSRAITPSDANINQATNLAADRDALVATFVGEHLPGPLATCASRLLVQVPSIRTQLLKNETPTNQDRELLLRQAAAAGAACRQNSQAGIP
jgi:hypothetical protein